MKDVTDESGTIIIRASKMLNNPDGTVSLVMDDGQYASQEPNVYGKFNSISAIGPYERAKVNGQLITFWTRPQDKVFTYTWVETPN